jgi:hypothetical protein
LETKIKDKGLAPAMYSAATRDFPLFQYQRHFFMISMLNIQLASTGKSDWGSSHKLHEVINKLSRIYAASRTC